MNFKALALTALAATTLATAAPTQAAEMTGEGLVQCEWQQPENHTSTAKCWNSYYGDPNGKVDTIHNFHNYAGAGANNWGHPGLKPEHNQCYSKSFMSKTEPCYDGQTATTYDVWSNSLPPAAPVAPSSGNGIQNWIDYNQSMCGVGGHLGPNGCYYL